MNVIFKEHLWYVDKVWGITKAEIKILLYVYRKSLTVWHCIYLPLGFMLTQTWFLIENSFTLCCGAFVLCNMEMIIHVNDTSQTWTNVHEILVSFGRRVLCYPLYRHFKLVMKAYRDTIKILQLGKMLCLQIWEWKVKCF